MQNTVMESLSHSNLYFVGVVGRGAPAPGGAGAYNPVSMPSNYPAANATPQYPGNIPAASQMSQQMPYRGGHAQAPYYQR